MADLLFDTNSQEQNNLLNLLEGELRKDEPNPELTKKYSRSYMSYISGESGGSIAETLATLARQSPANAVAAVFCVRYLGTPDVLPDSTPENRMALSIVALCEAAVPDLVRFLRVIPKSQNFEKIRVLSGCHTKMLEILSPLTSKYGDIDALIDVRKTISGALSHKPLRQYLEPFQIKEIKIVIDALFGQVKRIHSRSDKFLYDIDDFHAFIKKTRDEYLELSNFLVQDHLLPFLNVSETIITQFANSQREQFRTEVIWGGTNSTELPKRYPLHEPGREIQILIPLHNTGPGIATDVRVIVNLGPEEIVLGAENIFLGNINPGDFSVTCNAMVISRVDIFDGIVSVDWSEVGSSRRKSKLIDFKVFPQASDIDWSSLEFKAPYNTGVAEGGRFYGRSDKVAEIASKILRIPMEPFYITGQKRIGKTSLSLAATNFAKDKNSEGEIYIQYRLWGEIAHSDPQVCVRQLGEYIEEFVLESFDDGLVVKQGNYDGSLSPLVKLFNLAHKTYNDKRYVVILDEFDEIPQELFLKGNLAETFFANLRAISRCKNVCLILVGGENIPFIMDRQGQKLNNFSRINLSYFSRRNEWADFKLLITDPTRDVLSWNEDAVSEIFNLTNGNPYFAKTICATVLRAAVASRDAHITAGDVRRAVEADLAALGTNSFAHLWQDGIPKSPDDREPDVLRRMRVLVAMARCLRHQMPLTATNIANSKASAELSEAEIPLVLKDFVRREVLRETEGTYEFNLPIFRLWLVDAGVSQLVADQLSDDLVALWLEEENAALIKSSEVVQLVNGWSTYRGKQICTDDVKAWYQQVESIRDQRLLFEILKRVKFYTEAKVRERLRMAHSILVSDLPLFVMKKRTQRRTDIVITYVDGAGKSGASYASHYAEENRIAAECVLPPNEFNLSFIEHQEKHGKTAAIVVVDDIAATGNSLATNIEKFVQTHRNMIDRTKLRFLTIAATPIAQTTIEKKLEKIRDPGLDIDFRSCEILSFDAYAFPDREGIWPDQDVAERAKSLCLQLGSRIYRNNPLGYGNLGLLVVFPNTVPNNTLPIIHSSSTAGCAHSWAPLFPRVVN